MMAKCDYCGTRILLGGVKEEGLAFCNEKCREKGYALIAAKHVPQDLLFQQVKEIHQGPCPKCNGSGPVDVHTSHSVWSLLVFTSWSSIPAVCCRSCGVRSQAGHLLFSLFCGWWGFPWGIVITPVQIVRNIVGLLSPPNSTEPSEKLTNIVKNTLAGEIIQKEPELIHQR